PLITPIFEGGAVGQPIPFTQFIQQPKLTTVALHKSFCVPDGGTVLLSGWNTLKGPEQEGKPLMVEILDTLCPPPASARETETVVLMVTPRIIVNEVEEARVPVIKNYLPSPKIVIQEEEELRPLPGLATPRTPERVFTETQGCAMRGKVCDILAS